MNSQDVTNPNNNPSFLTSVHTVLKQTSKKVSQTHFGDSENTHAKKRLHIKKSFYCKENSLLCSFLSFEMRGSIKCITGLWALV